MAEFWGLRAIAKRMKTTPRVIMRLQTEQGFLATQRRREGRRVPAWYTTDELILAWLTARSKADNERLRRDGRWLPKAKRISEQRPQGRSAPEA